MKVNELRIGNYIFDKWGNVHEVNLFTLKEINEIPKSHGYKPIPLTEDWLLKFEFNKNGNEWGKEILFVSYKKNNELFLNLCDMYLSFSLKYVHQLQNLYFALKQKEIKKL